MLDSRLKLAVFCKAFIMILLYCCNRIICMVVLFKFLFSVMLKSGRIRVVTLFPYTCVMCGIHFDSVRLQ